MNDFFTINGAKLDDSQIKAITSSKHYSLVVAGAGSGKTITILGKIKYLIEREDYQEDDILCISFTNESCISLAKKIKLLGYDIKVLTFHKLGLKLLKKDNLQICDDGLLSFVIDEYFKSFIAENNHFAKLLKRLFFTNTPFVKIFSSNEYLELKTTIKTFILLFKSNNFTEDKLYLIYKRSFFREKEILRHIIAINSLYTSELRSQGLLDFDDMIIMALKAVPLQNISYKYFIIDEFQDTSQVRFDLIREILNKTKAKLFVVGDDWQSIYRFSGCNLDIFLNFHKIFNTSEVFFLTSTYRNSQELINISAKFIMKNKIQLKKRISSNKSIINPIKIFVGFSFYEILRRIDNQEDLLVLGRTNKDIDSLPFSYKMTIHKSKGLEAENVLLINSDNIPSKIKDEKILRHVINCSDYIPFEEERRLFYVALTRTKNNVFIMVNKDMSIFIKELIKDNPHNIEIITK